MTGPEFGSLRSDDDQWDIVSGVGYTALLVAGWRALHAVGPQPLVVDDYAQDFVAASADPYLTGLLANPPTSVDQTAFPRLYGVQTRFFDDFFSAAGDAGIHQAVIVAAGLDSRAYRLEWSSGTTVFEVDLPKVLEFKARVLHQRGAVPKARRIEVAADLRTDWSTPLKAAGFDPQRPGAWSVEGLLPYLTGDAQHALFTRIGELCAPGSRLATGALGSRLDHEQLAALEADHPGVNMSGDVDFTALTYDDKTDPAGWLATQGWIVEPVRNTLELQAGYRRTPAVVDVKIDSFMRSQYVVATKA
ncbi:class I SAM-dependent methyltransferase [Mycobacterium shinjukuense]|uniref:S-adenosyl-L-methionine-dependent methyltransferase n=1 Tax=Mycobacterium shinjukuense TaxID=398694 RepID=A0A7I7MMA0_9MYCO|nr:class I SAM-dependent methyltransferase [Mycobacterium shinjukuense]MCV6984713.1 class I SAM-dependent methyltransferase [Mycobacterium shinjukuense]ORB67433.1 SAM-dependent methyltransferase [Mycobacterium shinjukuense]BBX73394.1 putative S-adenosyl-L-methionine-dependent methyltransferase [Mycobacterium shinjukuense]